MNTPALPENPPAGLAVDTDIVSCTRFMQSHRGDCQLPLGIVRPRSEKQVESVVRWANRHDVRLVAVSSPDGPRRRDDTALASPSVVVDLSGMAGVLHVSGRDAIAIIEPGVTFPTFDEALRPHGLRSLKPLLPRRNKSVLTSYLEREPMVAPQEHWDTSDPLAAISVTFGNGESFRTGGASIPGTLETNLQRGNRQMISPGPGSTDYTRVLLGSQGSLGIVHWASIYCERIPARDQAMFFQTSELAKACAFVRDLALRQVWTHCFILDRTQASAVPGQAGAEFGRHPDKPRWLVYLSISAPDARPDACMAWKRAEVGRLAAGAGVEPVPDRDISAEALAAQIQDPPAGSYKDAPLGAHREVFCLSQLSRVEALVQAVDPLLDEAAAQTDGGIVAGIYIQPTVQGVSCHVDFTLFHAPQFATAAAQLDRRVAAVLAEKGGFLSRPYGDWAQIAYERDPGIVPYLGKVKSMFDPRHVLNPGRLCF